MQASNRRPSPALVISIIALIVALTGTAYAGVRLGKNSVGSRQLKSKSVTTGKIANNAVTGAKVAKETLTGDDIKVGQLPSVPNANEAAHARNADTLGENHVASCPGGSTLIRGLCFDLGLNPQVADIRAAANACAAKGGFLPGPMELYSVKTVINLGSGIGTDAAVADQYYGDTNGGSYTTVTVDGSGAIEEVEVDDPVKYICAYQLVR